MIDDVELKSIVEDKTSGSSQILLALNRWLKKNLISIDRPEELFRQLRGKFPSFQNLQSYFDQLIDLYSLSRDKKFILKFIEDFESNSSATFDRIYKNLLEKVSGMSKFITISNSKTLSEIFFRMNNDLKHLHVIISESRPLCEGRLLADALLKRNISVTLITEAMTANIIRSADSAIIGADIILKDGSVVNKTGSLNLAIISKFYDKPFFVVTDRTKFSSHKKFDQKADAAGEIWGKVDPNLTITNNYFEIVDSKLITSVISD